MSYAQNFMKITPCLSSKISFTYIALRYLSRMEISGVKSDLKIIFSKESRDAQKAINLHQNHGGFSKGAINAIGADLYC